MGSVVMITGYWVVLSLIIYSCEPITATPVGLGVDNMRYKFDYQSIGNIISVDNGDYENSILREIRNEEFCESDKECQNKGGDYRCYPNKYYCVLSYGHCEDSCECEAKHKGEGMKCINTIGKIGSGKVCVKRLPDAPDYEICLDENSEDVNESDKIVTTDTDISELGLEVEEAEENHENEAPIAALQGTESTNEGSLEIIENEAPVGALQGPERINHSKEENSQNEAEIEADESIYDSDDPTGENMQNVDRMSLQGPKESAEDSLLSQQRYIALTVKHAPVTVEDKQATEANMPDGIGNIMGINDPASTIDTILEEEGKNDDERPENSAEGSKINSRRYIALTLEHKQATMKNNQYTEANMPQHGIATIRAFTPIVPFTTKNQRIKEDYRVDEDVEEENMPTTEEYYIDSNEK